MSLAKLQSRAAVEAAIAEFDRVGRVYSLEKYGFSKSREYMLRDPATGKLYDTKAIVGAASLASPNCFHRFSYRLRMMRSNPYIAHQLEKIIRAG